MTKISATIPEAVALSGLSRTKIYNLIKTGQIQPKKAGKRTLIMVEDLRHSLENLPAAA